MGSRKGLLRKLRKYEIVLPIQKGSEPMKREEINSFFSTQRRVRKQMRRD